MAGGFALLSLHVLAILGSAGANEPADNSGPVPSPPITNASVTNTYPASAPLIRAALVTQAPAPTLAPALPLPPNRARTELREEDFLLFAVVLDSATLTESLSAYGDPADPLLPVGELARLVDLAIDVVPARGSATGTLGEAQRPLTIDLGLNIARSGTNAIPLDPSDTAVSPSDIYIRASVLQKLLPMKIVPDGEALTITLGATEKLPIQARMERQKRAQSISADTGSTESVFRVESPYSMLSPPAFDVALETGMNTRSPKFLRRYDVRIAGDFLHMGYQGYLGSDEKGRPSSSRILFERRSRKGDLLGPLKATYVSAGDVFTPALALGPRSYGGRGFAFSTAPQEVASVFQRITLRGELPLGYDVELYINDVLRSGQRSPVAGRYEFIDVPLVRGINIIRVVLYGPRGERSEQTRVINVGGGQLAKGVTSLDFGMIEQERPLIDLRSKKERNANGSKNYGEPRIVTSLAYGLSSEMTLVGGVAIYPDSTGKQRKLLSFGTRSSLLGIAVQADAAHDFQGGSGFSLGLAGRIFGISAIARHAEYRGGFADETVRTYNSARPLARHSELTADMSLPPVVGKIIPISFRLERDVFESGGTRWAALGRASASFADILWSAGVDYQYETAPNSTARKQLAANLAFSKFIDYTWQVRGVADFDLMPQSALRAISLTASRDVSGKMGLRFGIGRTFGASKDLNLQAGAYFRLPFADLALTGDYGTAHNDWRIGVRLAFGLAFDPSANHYRVTRPGPAAGGSAMLHAFIDENANGHYDAGEAEVPDVVVEGGEKPAKTGADGHAFVTGLGNAAIGRLHINTEGVDGVYVSTPPSNAEFTPRAGHVIDIPYPLTPVGDVMAFVKVKGKQAKSTGLAAVRVRLVGEKGETIEGTTEFDGSVFFSEVRPGIYRLELDPDQARRLDMRFKEPTIIKVTPDGADEIEAEVVFGSGEK